MLLNKKVMVFLRIAMHRLSVFRLAKKDVYPVQSILPRSDPAHPVIF
jgi:hypothetical protein